MDMIPVIDLRLLSQAELNTLALSSSSSSSSTTSVPDISRCDDVIVPKIDRSVFNESAGSRKQTYSRLRLAPPKSHLPSSSAPSSSARRRGRPRSLGVTPTTDPVPSSSPNVSAAADEPGRKENEQIVHFLRQLFAKNGTSETLAPPIPRSNPPQAYSSARPSPSYNANPNPVTNPDGEGKKRGRKKKRTSEEAALGVPALEIRDREVFSVNGVAVDLVGLGENEDLFREDLRKRTAGLVTEAEFLEFMNRLDGQWGSRRKRRKIVDAAGFGDGLPKGWKLLLGLKRKDGNVWLHCRRYVSPSGKQFTSCKEVSSYLLSVVGSQEVRKPTTVQKNDNVLLSVKSATGCAAGLTHQASTTKETVSFYSSAAVSIPADCKEQVAPTKVENPEKTQLLNLLECRKCNLKFPDEDAHVQHLLTFHHRSAKRCRLGKSISSGVIIKDGKYECQFCHKMFTERHRYNGHVGSHVRNYSQSLELLSDEIVTEKRLEPSPLDTLEKEKVDLTHDTCVSSSISETNANDTDCKQNSLPPEFTLEASDSKSLDDHSYSYDEAGDKLRNYTESSNAMDAEVNVSLDTDSDPKIKAPETSCEISKNSPLESTPSGKFDHVQVSSCDGTYAKLRTGVESSNSMDIESNACLNVGYDSNYVPPETTAGSYVTEPVTTQVYVYDDTTDKNLKGFGETSTVMDNSHHNRYSEIVINPKCSAAESKVEDATSKSIDDQVNFHNMTEEDSRNSAEPAALADTDCDPKYSAPVIAHENTPDDSHIVISEADKNLKNVSEPRNSEIDANFSIGCNSKCSALENTLGTQSSLPLDTHHPTENIVNENLRNFDTTNSLDMKVNVSLHGNGSSLTNLKNAVCDPFIEKGFSVSELNAKTGTNIIEDKIDSDSHLINQSCSWRSSIEGGIFTSRGTKEIEQSLQEQQLHPESNLASQTRTLQSYNVQASTTAILTSGMEQHELAEIHNYANKQESNLGNELVSDKNAVVKNIQHDRINMLCNRQEGGFENSIIMPSDGRQTCDIETPMDNICPSNAQGSAVDSARKSCNDLDNGFGCVLSGSAISLGGDSALAEGSALESIVLNTSSLWVQPSNCLSTDAMMSDQGVDKLYDTHRKHDYLSGFEEVRLDGFGSSNSIMLASQDPGLRCEDSIDLSYNGDLGNVFSPPPIQLDWEMAAPNMVNRHDHLLTTMCMWCGAEFSPEGANFQAQSDSVGFICPTCKAKISGQLKF